MSSFVFDTSCSAIWIVSGVVLDGAPVTSARLIDGEPMYRAGESLGALLIGTCGRETANGSVFSVRWLWSGDIIGRAGGGGYDRQGTALSRALSYLYGLPVFDGGIGESSVREHAARHGVSVEPAGSVAWGRASALGVLS